MAPRVVEGRGNSESFVFLEKACENALAPFSPTKKCKRLAYRDSWRQARWEQSSSTDAKAAKALAQDPETSLATLNATQLWVSGTSSSSTATHHGFNESHKGRKLPPETFPASTLGSQSCLDKLLGIIQPLKLRARWCRRGWGKSIAAKSSSPIQQWSESRRGQAAAPPFLQPPCCETARKWSWFSSPGPRFGKKGSEGRRCLSVNTHCGRGCNLKHQPFPGRAPRSEKHLCICLQALAAHACLL